MTTGARVRRIRPSVSLTPSPARGPGPGHNGGPPLDPSGLAWIWRRASQRAWKTPPREIALARLRQAEALGLSYHEFTAVLMDRGQRLSGVVIVLDDARVLGRAAIIERLGRLGAARVLLCLRGAWNGALPEPLSAVVDTALRLDGAVASLDAAVRRFLDACALAPGALFMVGTRADDLAVGERCGLALFKWADDYFGGGP